MELKVTPWTQETPPTEEELQNLLIAQELNVYRWSNNPDDVYPGHTHGYHKVLYVIEGSIKFDLPTQHETVNLKAGDKLELHQFGVCFICLNGRTDLICPVAFPDYRSHPGFTEKGDIGEVFIFGSQDTDDVRGKSTRFLHYYTNLVPKRI